MRCELFEQLIPLHIGGDLESSEANDLRQHLNSCAHCRRLNEDFQASQNWLAGFAAPEFDEASFAKMRASVLSEIEQQEKRGRWPGWPDWKDWLLPKFSPRFVLASAAIALAVVSGLIAAVYRQQVVPTKTGGEVIADNSKSGSPIKTDGKVIAATGGQLSAATGRERGFSRPRHSKTEELPPEAFTNGGSLNPLEPPVAPPDEPTIENAAAPATPNVSAEPEPKEMLRIELQTADPNIRIIWLTPKASGSPAIKPSDQTR